MGVQRGENSKVQKVSSDCKQIRLSAGHSGPFQADLTATPVPSMCHTESWLRSPGQVQGTLSHTLRCAGFCQTLTAVTGRGVAGKGQLLSLPA